MGQPLGVVQKENEAGNDNDAAPDPEGSGDEPGDEA